MRLIYSDSDTVRKVTDGCKELPTHWPVLYFDFSGIQGATNRGVGERKSLRELTLTCNTTSADARSAIKKSSSNA